MTRIRPTRFSEAFLRQVLDVLDEHPLGCTLAQIVEVTGRQPDSCAKALRIVGEKTWAGNRTTPPQYLRHVDADSRVREHCQGHDTSLPPAPPTLNFLVEGMCPGCTCDPDPSEFVMKNGRPVMLGCPKQAPLPASWFAHAQTAPVTRHMIPVPAPERQRRSILRALRMAEAPLAQHELLAATSLRTDELSAHVTDLEAEGTVVRLRRIRAGSGGQAAIAVFALAITLPESLRGPA